MTSDNLIATVFLLLVAFDLVLMVILARKWAPRCQECRSRHVKVLSGAIGRPGPAIVCRDCGYVEVL